MAGSYEDYTTFPSFINVEEIYKLPSFMQDTPLYWLRENITHIIQYAVKCKNSTVTISLHNLGNPLHTYSNATYNHIKILHDELTERGFMIKYTQWYYEGGLHENCDFKDLDPNAKIPAHGMTIRWL